MADKLSYLRDDSQRPALFKRLWHGRKDGNYVPVVKQDLADGNTLVRSKIKTTDQSAAADLSTSPAALNFVFVDELRISSAAAITIELIEETSNTVLQTFYTVAGTQILLRPEPGTVKTLVAAKKLQVKASGAGAFAIDILYHIAVS